MMTQDRIDMKGFAPPGLIEQLEKAVWTTCHPEGENFCALELGGYCLTRPADRLCPMEYQVTVEDNNSGQRFIITGFSFQGLFREVVEQNPNKQKNRVCDEPLRSKTIDGLVPYTLTIEVV